MDKKRKHSDGDPQEACHPDNSDNFVRLGLPPRAPLGPGSGHKKSRRVAAGPLSPALTVDATPLQRPPSAGNLFGSPTSFFGSPTALSSPALPTRSRPGSIVRASPGNQTFFKPVELPPEPDGEIMAVVNPGHRPSRDRNESGSASTSPTDQRRLNTRKLFETLLEQKSRNDSGSRSPSPPLFK